MSATYGILNNRVLLIRSILEVLVATATNMHGFTPKEVFVSPLPGATAKVLSEKHLNFVEAGLSRPAAVVIVAFVAFCVDVNGRWCAFTRSDLLERLHDEARRGILCSPGRMAFSAPESRHHELFERGVDDCVREGLLRIAVDSSRGEAVLYPTTGIARAYQYA